MAGSLADYIATLSTNYAKLNPYSTIGSGIGQVNLPTEGNTLNQNIVASIVKGLLSGGLQAYGNYENKQYTKGLRDLAVGNSTTANLSDSEISDIQNDMDIFRQSKAEDAQEAMNKLQLEIGAEGAKAEAKTKGELKAQSEASAGDPDNPLNPVNKARLEKDKQNDAYVTSARDFLKTADPARAYMASAPLLGTIQKNLDRSDKVADLDIMKALLKIQDPLGSINQGEFRSAEEAIPALEKYFGNAKSFFTGQGILTPEAKMLFLESAANKVNEFGKSYDQLVKSELNRVKTLGANEKLVSYTPYNAFDLESFKANRAAAAKIKDEYKSLVVGGIDPKTAAAQIKTKYGQ